MQLFTILLGGLFFQTMTDCLQQTVEGDGTRLFGDSNEPWEILINRWATGFNEFRDEDLYQGNWTHRYVPKRNPSKMLFDPRAFLVRCFESLNVRFKECYLTPNSWSIQVPFAVRPSYPRDLICVKNAQKNRYYHGRCIGE